MPDSPLIAAGAQVGPINAACLHTNEFFTGMWTQGSPLGGGAVPFLQQKYYSAARFDRLIGGQNTEITTRLTLARRPGNSVYNNGAFPPINRFYEFRAFTGSTEQIHVIASVDPATGLTHGTVRDVTGPANNLVLWTKDATAGRTSFQSVGNILFFADGVDAKKWVQSQLAWKANSSDFAGGGDFIVDSNNNLQEAVAAQTATIAHIQVSTAPIPGPPFFRKVTLYLDPTTPLNLQNGSFITLAGLTTRPILNGLTISVIVQSSLQVWFIVPAAGGPANTAYTAETGTATTGTGITGAAQPVWGNTLGAVTQDNTLQWICKGSSVQNWGFDGPANPPAVSQAPGPAVYAPWAASTWYAPLFVIVDSNGNLQQLTTGGQLGAAPPVWNLAVGGVTADNTARWTNKGTGAWLSNHAYVAGDLALVTFSYWITYVSYEPVWNGYTYVPTPVINQVEVSVTQLFKCTTNGVSGNGEPSWINGVGTFTTDNTVGWTNLGAPDTWATLGANALVSTAAQVLDSNGYIESATQFGKTGAAQPAWTTLDGNPQEGASTVDSSQIWTNGGPFAPANTGVWKWAYSGKNSITGHISTASPVSTPLLLTANNLPVLQGVGPSDPQEDTIVLWRTLQGGATLLYDDEFPNPGAGQSWVYTDTTQDSRLNEFITAPISHKNDPPPAGFTPQCYYLNRIWGFVANRLKWSGGPDTITGSGDEAFPPGNEFIFPSLGVTCWPTSLGLICYTNSDVWVVLGQGTGNSPFYVVNFQQGVGLANQDAFTVNGSTAYGMLTSGQVVSMDPGAGELEIGFPIGDRFDAEYTTAGTYMAWHQGSSADTALYAGDGALGWYRMAAVAAPESGNVWSPRALITNGVKALASIEIAPGQKRLLLGPAAQGQPILMRDTTVSTDNGTAYTATANLASVVMAQPGTTVGVQFVVTEEKAIAGSSPVSIGILYDEISGVFSNLTKASNDPPNLPGSKTVLTRRFWAMQDAKPIICRHLQTEVSWAAEPYANELYTHSIYGRLPEKARK